MDVKDKIIVITGGGSGIGRSMAQLFAAEGARHISVADLNEAGALGDSRHGRRHGVCV